jgi:hypothetical protein
MKQTRGGRISRAPTKFLTATAEGSDTAAGTPAVPTRTTIGGKAPKNVQAAELEDAESAEDDEGDMDATESGDVNIGAGTALPDDGVDDPYPLHKNYRAFIVAMRKNDPETLAEMKDQRTCDVVLLEARHLEAIKVADAVGGSFCFYCGEHLDKDGRVYRDKHHDHPHLKKQDLSFCPEGPGYGWCRLRFPGEVNKLDPARSDQADDDDSDEGVTAPLIATTAPEGNNVQLQPILTQKVP